jgi:hypothetical protein
MSELTPWLSSPELHPWPKGETLGERVIGLFLAIARHYAGNGVDVVGTTNNKKLMRTSHALTPELNLLYLHLHTAPPSQIPSLLELASAMYGEDDKEEGEKIKKFSSQRYSKH